MDREIIEGVYRHFKGNNYLVLYVAKHTETMEEMVVYCELGQQNRVWIRPLKMFMSEVDLTLLNITEPTTQARHARGGMGG